MNDFVNAFNEIVSSYAATALWSSYAFDTEEDSISGQNGFNLDDRYDITDISDETMNSFREDIVGFLHILQTVGINWVEDDISSRMSWSQFGHDFWLTRNGHGAGFWDRGLGEFGEQLTKWAKTFGEVNLSVNDDNEIEAY